MSSITEHGSSAVRGPKAWAGRPGGPPADTSPCDDDLARRLSEGLAALPAVGSDFLGFRLVDELGRGAFGRVYLARQADLADRLVALKVSVDLSGEPQLLARLQHTNIVPIYSAHRAGPLQAVCMPYFGPTTLADVLRHLHGSAVPPEGGDALVSLLHGTVLQASPAMPPPGAAPARDRTATVKMLTGMDFVRAVLWVGTRLADGLGHAHERGILHRDLKPANVLLSDDGQPMLLDFNLAEVVCPGPGAPAALLGGTLPYMAPEQLGYLRGDGCRGDERADLYSLGILLFELLAGKRPFPDRRGPLAEVLPLLAADRLRPPPRLRGGPRAVTPAVEAIMRRCLEPDPARRYPSAQELREDLQCQLDDRPLRHTPEPSLRERLRKWRRRHPRLVSPLLALGVLTVAAALWGVNAAWQHSDEIRSRAADEKRQADGEKRQAERAERAREAFALVRQDADAAARCEAEVDADLLMPEGEPAARKNLAAQAEYCRRALGRFGVLEDAAWRDSPPVLALSEAERPQLRTAAGELLYLLARGERLELEQVAGQARKSVPVACALHLWPAATAGWGGFEAALHARAQAALRLAARAEACYPADQIPRPLVLQRAALTRLLGNAREGQALEARAGQLALRSPRELYRAAREAEAAGRYAEALPLLEEATRGAPQQFSAWLLRAVCQDRAGRHEEAEASYTVCLALRPDFFWGRLARGKTYLVRGQWAQAEQDFTGVLERRPDLGPVYVLRAEARRHQDRKTRLAVADLEQAGKHRERSVAVVALRARLREELHDRVGADGDRAELRALTPDSAGAWLARGMARAADDAEGALADVDRALALEPRSVPALFQKARLLAGPLAYPRQALPVLDRVLTLNPNHAGARLQRAFVRARLGRREGAHEDAEHCLLRDGTPRMYYLVGVVYALTARQAAVDRHRALGLLAEALRNGYGQKELAQDPDLWALYDEPDFAALCRAVQLFDHVQRSEVPGRVPARKRP